MLKACFPSSLLLGSLGVRQAAPSLRQGEEFPKQFVSAVKTIGLDFLHGLVPERLFLPGRFLQLRPMGLPAESPPQIANERVQRTVQLSGIVESGLSRLVVA